MSAPQPGTLRFKEILASPAAPPVGYATLYVKTDNVVYLKDSGGVEIPLGTASGITALTGDVTAVGPGFAVATVAFVGGSSAALVHSAELLANAATATNTALAIVLRDASGNFAAGTITANLVGSASSFTGSLSGDVTGTQSATVVAFVGTSSAANVHSAELLANAATSANTSMAIVRRDASGNFSAGTITATLNGSATSFSGVLAGDVTGTQSTTVVAFVGTSSAANVHSAELLANAATSANTASAIVRRNASGNFTASTVTLSDLQSGTVHITGGAGNVLVVDGNVLVVDATNNRVGINKTSPTEALDVVGNGTFTGTLAASNLSGTNTGDITISDTNSIDLTLIGQLLSADLKLSSDAADSGYYLANTTIHGNGLHVEVTIANTSTTGVITSTDWNTFNNKQPAGSYITALTGDVTATGPGSVAATVAFVGTSSAANVHSAELLANAATSANTALAIVRRDASGNFSAGTITANLTGNVTGSASNNVLKAGDTMTGELLITAAGTGLNVSNDVVVGGNISATGTVTGSNLSGTNTGDVTISDTNSIDLTLVGQLLSADLKLSSDAADAGNIKATYSIHSGGGAGLFIEIPFDVPVQIGTSNFVGASVKFALSDHVHAHGNQTSGTLHAVVTSSVNGFMSAADKVKLDAATNLNTASTIVMRDASGNFSASTITANLTGNASGTSSTFTGSLTGDVTSIAMATTIAVGAVTDTKASLSNKPAVTVVATSNQTLSGTPTIDGQATAVGSLILLIAQTTGSENGPWVAAAGAWTRPTWYPSGGTTQAFQFITALVRLGTTYQGSTWRMTTGGAITIDTTSTTWVVTPHALNASTVTGILPNANTTGTSANTPNTLVLRDGSGNFSAGTITATLSGSATSATSFTGSLSGDVTGTQSATVVALVGGSTAANVHSAELLANAATSANTASAIVRRDGSGGFSAGAIVAASLAATGSVTGSNLSGTNTGDVTLAAFGSTPNANAASLSGQILTLQPADATHPGGVSITAQTLAGNKTFSGQTAITDTSTTAFTVNTNALIVDATNKIVGVGVTPDATVALIDVVNSTGSSRAVQTTGYGGSVGYRGRYANGTSGSPTAAVATNILNFMSARGYGASAFASAATASINMVAAETFTNTSMKTYVSINVTPTASVTSAEAFRVAATGVTVGPQSASTAIHQINGGVNVTRRTITANTTIDTTTTDYLILCNNSGVINLTLPAPTDGRVLVIMDVAGTASTNNVTIVRHGSEKISGLAASFVFQTNWGSLTIYSDGTDWFVS